MKLQQNLANSALNQNDCDIKELNIKKCKLSTAIIKYKEQVEELEKSKRV